jgi:RNA polymerase sigma-B factor
MSNDSARASTWSTQNGEQPMTRAERSERTRDLLEQAQHTRDERQRDELLDEVVLINRGVAEAVAARYRGRGVPAEDLQQAAYEGLVKAVHKFDPSVRPDLLTYAVPTIRGEVQRWFRDQSWMVRPPRRIQELQWRISRSIDHLSQDLGRPPSDVEVSKDVGCSTEEINEAVQGFGCFQPPSLDLPVGESGTPMGELLGTDDEREKSLVEAREALAPVVQKLSERDRRILYLRFIEDQSQSEIGEELGVTQMQVSRLLERIFRTMRSELGPTQVPQVRAQSRASQSSRCSRRSATSS